jgi:hypothetical protein
MARKPKWRVEVCKNPGVNLATGKDLSTLTLKLHDLSEAQVAFIRCMLQTDLEVDPVEDWGFKKKDGDLQTFRMDVAAEIERQGF